MWTPEEIEELKRLRDVEKLTGSQIAKRLAEMFGRPFTRSMISGKVDRIYPKQLKRKQGTGNTIGFGNKRKLLGQLETKGENGKETKVKSKTPVELLEIEDHQCRWIICDNPYLYCGNPKINKGPYCEGHEREAVR